MLKKEMLKRLGCLVVMIVVFGLVVAIDNNYTRECRVDSVENGVVTFVDTCGYKWEWELEEGETFQVNEEVKLLMNKNVTDNNITDDYIQRVVK